MLEEVRDKRGVDLDEVGRVDVIRGKLIVQDKSGETIFEEPIRDFHGGPKGCDECADFMGHAADISVGSVGSADGVLERPDPERGGPGGLLVRARKIAHPIT